MMFRLFYEDSNTLAAALPCMIDGETKRPIFGASEINVKYFSDDKSKMFDSLQTITHEVFHALGFTDYMYQYFIDPSNGEIKGADEFIINDSISGNSYFIGPNTLNYAKNLYNCQTIIGI